MLVFLLLSSEDGFSTKWKPDAEGILRAPAVYNGAQTGLLGAAFCAEPSRAGLALHPVLRFG